MQPIILISVATIFFFSGLLIGSIHDKYDGFFIIDDRLPDKTSITVDLHKDQKEIEKQKTVVFRVLKKI